MEVEVLEEEVEESVGCFGSSSSCGFPNVSAAIFADDLVSPTSPPPPNNELKKEAMDEISSYVEVASNIRVRVKRYKSYIKYMIDIFICFIIIHK